MRKSSNTATYASYNNRPIKLPSPEDISLNTLMAFTYNPNFTPYDETVIDMKTYNNDLVDVFSQLKYCKIKLVHEISCMGKFHLHGYIMITHKIKFYTTDIQILKLHGVFEIDFINDEEIWETYVYKLKDDMKEHCKEYGCPYKLDTIEDKLYKCKVDALTKMKKCKKEEPEQIPSWMPPPDSST